MRWGAGEASSLEPMRIDWVCEVAKVETVRQDETDEITKQDERDRTAKQVK
jgi:hypothetical protein